MQRRSFVAAMLAAPAVAQPQWPDRQVRIVVPDAPGGGNDITGRIFAHHLERAFGQAFPVDNRVGAGGRQLRLAARGAPYSSASSPKLRCALPSPQLATSTPPLRMSKQPLSIT